MSEGPLIEAEGLRKVFGNPAGGEVVAVDSLSLTVGSGEVYGLLGPNGAGKTTTLSMATGLLRPTSGSARVLGTDVWADPAAAKAIMGVAPDGLRMFEHLTGRELLTYTGALRRMDPRVVEQRAAELLGVLELDGDQDLMVADYSAGMKKKISLACALIHAPELLILDEPFESIDPVSGQVIRSILRKLVAGGRTVVMSSHVMELVEGLCDHVAVVAAGRVLAHGPLDDVRAGKTMQERFLELVGARGDTGEGLTWLD